MLKNKAKELFLKDSFYPAQLGGNADPGIVQAKETDKVFAVTVEVKTIVVVEDDQRKTLLSL